MNILYYVAYFVVMLLVAKATAPKPKKQKAAALEDFEFPTAEEGREIPVIFGETTVAGPNVIWYGDLRVHTQTRDGVKTRTYYMGVQFGISHGPVDLLKTIYVDDLEAWTGNVTSSQQIYIDARNLFGGDEKEGGIRGYFDVMMGESTQGANSYLASNITGLLPNFRGRFTGVYRQGMIAVNNPYPKPWSFRVKRILAGWDIPPDLTIDFDLGADFGDLTGDSGEIGFGLDGEGDF